MYEVQHEAGRRPFVTHLRRGRPFVADRRPQRRLRQDQRQVAVAQVVDAEFEALGESAAYIVDGKAPT